MDTPLISVILATYNGSRYLEDAIASVLSQDYQNFELLIIDDASTDKKVAEIVQKYAKQDPRVRIFCNNDNRERSWSKNFGVEQSRGEYCAFIDDDDIWLPTKLSKQIDPMIDRKNLGIIGTYASFIDESGNSLWETHHLKAESHEIKKNILITNQFIHSSVLVRKDIFQKSWWFPVDMNLCEDYDLWFRMLSISEGANIPEFLVKYRVRWASTTTKNIYRMKYYSLILTHRYRNIFPGFSRAFAFRFFSFPINTVGLLRIWKKLYRK
jgi:glycosyltransferase involved in cell wall biosynthesis